MFDPYTIFMLGDISLLMLLVVFLLQGCMLKCAGKKMSGRRFTKCTIRFIFF